MNAAVLVLLVVVPLIIWGLVEIVRRGIVYIDAGSAGLLLVRGKTTERVLQPGPHFIWPFRQQGIAVYPLRELTYQATSGAIDPDEFGDPPVHAQLGDHAPVTVHYALRFRIRPDAMQGLHDRVGPDGIGRLVRDISRRVVLDELDQEQYDVSFTFGANLDRLEANLTERMSTALSDAGMELEMLTVLDVDLGAIGEVLDETVQAHARVDLERAEAQVRAARAASDAELAHDLGFLTAEFLTYQRNELLREALQRWDGRLLVTDPRTVLPVEPGEGATA